MKIVLILILIVIFIFVYTLNKFIQKRTLRNRLMPLTYINNFPKIIFRTYNDKEVCLSMFENCHEKWLEMNPNFSMIWFSNDDCDRFMKKYFKGVICDCYNLLNPGAYKADLWRLCILYKFGGIYVDAFCRPFMSIEKMIQGCNCDFISVLDSSFSKSGIHNGFIVSIKKHPFLKQGIKDIVHNVKKRYYGSCPLSITGPVCLLKSIKKVLKSEKEPKIGLNKNIFSFYLYQHVYGPYQNVYKNDKKVFCKYFSFLYYLYRKIFFSTTYTKLWKARKVYN